MKSSYIFYYKNNKKCPHCNYFMPKWNKLKDILNNNIELKLIDCHDINNENLVSYYNIKVPTLILSGKKTIRYNGPRDINHILNFINNNAK